MPATRRSLWITRKRFRLDETLCQRDRNALAEDVDRAFVKKAKQIHDSIADFKRGLYQLGEVDPNTINRYIPAIVTEQDFPQIIALPHVIHTAVRDAGWLEEYEPLQILAAEDVEAVYQSAESTGDLLAILTRKAANESYRYRDLPSYLHDFEPAVLRPNADGRSLPGHDDLFDGVILTKLREWGLQPKDAKTA